ncbi:MAG: dephospho-CoA kinase [Clostridia bacterium]|nr:dephospho-CoA kinase [Clostridia bacterium]
MIIGLTGSMAAGKSTVSNMLIERGFTVIDADRVSREITEDELVKSALNDAFGGGVFAPNGDIDRAALADAAFSSRENTAKLNAITHPAIIKRLILLAKEAESLSPVPVFCDVPLLFETGFDAYCDRVIVVAASDEVRYLRIMLRDGLPREKAKLRIEKQMPQEEKIARACAVIMNDGTLYDLERSVDAALSALGVTNLPSPDNDYSLSDEEQ